MSHEINHHGSRFLEREPMHVPPINQSTAQGPILCTRSSVETHRLPNGGKDQTLATEHTLYSAAVLAELSALARDVRAMSPNSILADIADTKISRSIALCDDDNMLRQGAPRCTKHEGSRRW